MSPLPANVSSYSDLAADVDSIIATVALGLGIERDRKLQAGLSQMGAAAGRSGLLLELSPTWGFMKITADRGVVPQRSPGEATTTLEFNLCQARPTGRRHQARPGECDVDRLWDCPTVFYARTLPDSAGILSAAEVVAADREGEHAKSWGASKFLNAKLRAFGKETALWGSWFGG